MNGTIKKNELTQEFVLRVKVLTSNTDPKVVRELLDKVEERLRKFRYEDGTGTVEVVLIHPN